MRGALLEDDPEVAAAVRGWLEQAGHQLVHYADGLAMLRAQRRESFDFFLLDWMVPGATGEEVLRQLRGEFAITAPILFVTARDTEDDVATVLQAGADDYLAKPLRRRELIARIDAVMRRRAPLPNAGVLEVGPYRVDLGLRTVHVDGQDAGLTDKEFDLAAFLFQRLGSVVSKGHVAESVWGHNDTVVSRTVDVHIGKIRRKLSLGPARGVRLATIYGFGYRLEAVTPDET